MRPRRASLVLPFLLVSIVHPPFATADERDRFHAWLFAGPTFLLDTSPRFGSPAVPFGLVPSSTALALPAGDNAKGAIPQFQAGFAIAATPKVSLSFDVRSFEVEQRNPVFPREPSRLSVLAWGPGVRRTVGSGSLRPFLQANVFVLTEDLSGSGDTGSHQGVGLGLLAGADVHLTDALSFPIAATVLLGQPRSEVSSVGLVAGLAVHPSTGWSADPTVRAIEMREREPTAVEAPPRSRLELGLGWSEAQNIGGYTDDSGNFLVAHVAYLRSMKPGLGLTFDSRLYRRRSEGSSFFYEEFQETRTIVLVGPGIRFTRTAGWARRFFEANLWFASDTRTIELDQFESSWRRTGPGLGFAVGLDVQLSRRLVVPLALRYDHLIERDDHGLATLEGGLAVALGRDGD